MTQCPDCKTEFEETPPWDIGQCPKCGKEYIWDEIEADDDWWPVIVWDAWDSL